MKNILLLFILLICCRAESFAQTANDYSDSGAAKDNIGDYKGAMLDYNKAIELDTNNADTHLNRGISKWKLNDYIGVIQDMTKAIILDSNRAVAYYFRGQSKYMLRYDYRGSIQDLNKAIEINPYYAVAYYYRGMSKYNLGDKDGACLDWNKACELGANYVSYFIQTNCH